MKILFFESGTIWSRGLPDGLREIGHKVLISGPLTLKKTPTLIKSFRPDLLVTVGWGLEHSKEKQLWMRRFAKEAKIPLVYWATEDPNFTKEYTLPLIRRMKPDFIFTISPKTAVWYQKLGLPAAHMDFAYHSSIHRRLKPSPEYASNIAIVANAYPQVLQKYSNHYRHQSINLLIKPLIQKGIRVDFYGRDWDKMGSYLGRPIPRQWIHGAIPYKDANKVYSSAKIMLGPQNYPDMVTQRTYEILGSGGFLLTCNTKGVRKLLKPGRDVAVTTSPKETIQLVQRYLNDKKERERIRIQGRIAIARHNYRNRAQYMLRILSQQGLIKK